jgi:hypothetical protein
LKIKLRENDEKRKEKKRERGQKKRTPNSKEMATQLFLLEVLGNSKFFKLFDIYTWIK